MTEYSDEEAAALYAQLNPWGPVTFTETTGGRDGTPWRVDRVTLRFLDANDLGDVLTEAGFEIAAQYGGWLGEPFGPASPEIITVALKDS